MNTPDPKQIEKLLNSEIFKSAEREADQNRIASHQAAADALLAHEADTALAEAANAAIETARRELEPIAGAYQQARTKLAGCEATARRINWRRDMETDRLQSKIRKQLPEIVFRTESALIWVDNDIRAACADRSTDTGRGCVYSSNQAQVSAAREQVSAMRELLGRLTFDPMPTDEIIRRLSAEAMRLIALAKAAGAIVGHHLPAEIRGGGPVEEVPEREKRRFAFPR